MDRIVELYSSLVHKERNNNYSLRVIEYPNKDGSGTFLRKFGLSEFWWCDKSKRWYPSRKHHTYLPLSAWPELLKLDSVITSFASKTGAQGHSVAGDAADQPAYPDTATSSTGRLGRAAKRAHGDNNDGDDSGADTGPTRDECSFKGFGGGDGESNKKKRITESEHVDAAQTVEKETTTTTTSTCCGMCGKCVEPPAEHINREPIVEQQSE